MARTRVSLNSTKFMNSKRRVIGMTASGKYAVRTAKGGLVYNPKAKYVKSPGGTERTLINSKARVPVAIRPTMMRKMRSNKGTKRGVRAGPHMGNLPRLFRSPKVRSNKGVKRGVRAGPHMGNLNRLFGMPK